MIARSAAGFCVLGILVLVAACQPAQQSSAPAADKRPSDVAMLRQTADNWKQAIGSRDTDRIVGYYTDDAWTIALDGSVASTAAARREYWQAIASMPIVTDVVDVSDRIDVAASGDLAVQYGEFRQIFSDKKGNTSSVPQRFMTVWKRQKDGAWKVGANMATVKPLTAPDKSG